MSLPDPSFWARVDASGPCWIWTGARQPSGYGIYELPRQDGRRRRARAHRHAWELLVGPIPPELVIDHLCRVKLCVNPDHLEPVPQRVNALRGMGPTHIAYRRRTCVNGHPQDDPQNYRRPDGVISCRICRREYHARYYQARKAS